MFVEAKLFLYRPSVAKLICLVMALFLLGQIINGVVSLYSIDKIMYTAHVPLTEIKNEVKPKFLNAGLTTLFFGEYVPKNLNDLDVKQSMLNLKVVGILYSDSEKNSNVIIRTSEGREQTYRVGDSLPGGAVIKRITPDGVLVVRKGALERLSLPKNELIFEAPAKPLRNSLHAF